MMQSNFKRTLGLILVLLMVLALVPMAALAAQSDSSSPFVAKNTATGTQYETVKKALSEAQTGETVVLLCDAQASGFLTVAEGTTLDLNGYALTAKYVSCFGQIADNSKENSGLLKVSQKTFLIQDSNDQLAVKDTDGYRFINVKGFNTKVMDNGSRYVFQPLFNPAAHELLRAGKNATGISIEVRVSWRQGDNIRTQGFYYNDTMVRTFLDSYNAATGKYGKMFVLTLQGAENYRDLTFNAMVASSLGICTMPIHGTGNATVDTDDNNQLSGQVSIQTGVSSAVVLEGTQLEADTTQLTLTTSEITETGGNISLAADESLLSMNVHVQGVAPDNTVPILVTLDEIAPKYLNQGNLALYHLENGEVVAMTQVYSLDELDAHNEFYYNTITGTVTMAVSTFSTFRILSNDTNKWNGNYDYSWYIAPAADDTAPKTYTIANADQLAAFGAIVGGMNNQPMDDFNGDTVKLIADVNLGDAEASNNESLIFYPIGYYNNEGTYEKTNTAITSSVSSFEGTFDGTGHTIKNFYQNTWEMKGDDSYYSPSEQRYNDAMGLFGYVYNGTVKNLTVDHFSSDGEYTPTGVIAAYACNSTFENITITNCNPKVYNTGNGGIVGIGGNSGDPDSYKLTFNNITVDSTNKITALWGSWDVACGGLVGMFRGAGHAYMNNCHVAAQMDVYNDVCGNYQYYWYRYSGMLIGTNKNMITDAQGYTVPETDKFHATGCTVHFGDWNNYYYCELVANSLASYTHDHQFSRLTPISNLSEIWDGTNWKQTGNFLVTVDGKKECRHVIKDANGNLIEHLHENSGEETVDVNGDGIKEKVLKENNQVVFLPFNQLFTGYGWGVKHIPIYNDESLNPFEGVTILDRTNAQSIVKFQPKVADIAIKADTTLTLGDLFRQIGDVKINPETIQVFVTPITGSNASGTYTANASDWTKSIIAFAGNGGVEVTISDYNFCITSKLSVLVVSDASAELENVYCVRGHTMADHAGANSDCELYCLVWTDWESGTSLPTANGNYRLTKNVALKNQARALSGTCLTFDLLGHDIVSEARAFMVKDGGNLVITDTPNINTPETQGTVKTTMTEMTTDIAGGGVIYVHSNSTVNIYAGKYDGRSLVSAPRINEGNDPQNLSEVTRHGGTVMHILKDSVVYIEGGTMWGGISWRGATIYNNGNLTIAGNAVIHGGRANNMGGTIYNAYDETAVIAYNEDQTSSSNNGVCIVRGNATVNCGYSAKATNGLIGGTIIITENATLNSYMYLKNAGQEPVIPEPPESSETPDASTPEDTEGLVDPILIKEAAERTIMSLNVLTKNLVISGNANINGQIKIIASQNPYLGNITVKDAPVFTIPGVEAGHPALFFVEWGSLKDSEKAGLSDVQIEAKLQEIEDRQRNLLDVTKLIGGSGLTIRLPEFDRTGVFGAGAPGVEAYIKSNTAGFEVILNSDNKLEMIQLTCGLGHTVHDHLGWKINNEIVQEPTAPDCKLELLHWKEWSNANALPTVPGNYRLTTDVTLSKQVDYLSGTWNIDLNGHTVSIAQNNRIMLIGNGNTSAEAPAVVNLYNSKETGGMVYAYASQFIDNNPSDGNTSVYGSIAYVHQNSTLNAYHVKMDVSKITSSAGGDAICIGYPTAAVNLYGCQVLGSNTPNIGGNAILLSNGSLRLESTTVTGNVYVGNQATEGSIVLTGSTTITPGTVRPYGLRLESDIKVTCTNWNPATPLIIQGKGYYSTSALNQLSPIAGYAFAPTEQIAYSKLATTTCIHGNSITEIKNCGCTNNDLKPWVNWDNTTALPVKAGYWRLTQNVVLKTTAQITSGDVHLDLNGKTVSSEAAGYRLIRVANATLTLYNGNLTYGHAAPAENGSVAFIDTNGTLNAHNVTMNAETINGFYGTATDGTTCCALIMSSNATGTNLYNCTVIGANGDRHLGRTFCVSGGNLVLDGTTIMGGVRIGETATATTLTLKGNVQLLSNNYTYGLYVIPNTTQINCTGLSTDSQVEVFNNATFTFADNTAATAAANVFTAKSSGYSVSINGAHVVVSKPTIS